MYQDIKVYAFKWREIKSCATCPFIDYGVCILDDTVKIPTERDIAETGSVIAAVIANDIKAHNCPLKEVM